MRISDFEKELQAIDPNLSIRTNNPPKRVVDAFPDVLKLASVTYYGTEVCTVPTEDIFDERNGNYGVDLRNDGRFIAHRTRPEVIEIVKNKLKFLKNKDEADAFFGRGDYSNEALSKNTPIETTVELVEEVKGTMEEING